MNTIGYFEIQSSKPDRDIKFMKLFLDGNLLKKNLFPLNITE